MTRDTLQQQRCKVSKKIEASFGNAEKGHINHSLVQAKQRCRKMKKNIASQQIKSNANLPAN